MMGVVDTMGLVGKSSADRAIESVKINPEYRYLRLSIGRLSTLMVLGYYDPDPLGTVEVWYSSGAEVLRMQNGRVVGASGMPVDWSGVRLSANPNWEALAAPVTYTRTRDVMPGYHYGIKDTITLSPIAPPSGSKLVKLSPSALDWFEERTEGLEPLPPARYAVSRQGDKRTVVYGEQCLSVSFCFSWQLWPVQEPGAQKPESDHE